MKIVMVRTKPVNTDTRIKKEAETLTENGYVVTILGWDRLVISQSIESENNYTIKEMKLKAQYGIKVIFYLPVWLCFEFIWLLKEKFDTIHAVDFDTLLPALIVAKIKMKPIIYDIFDFYAQHFSMPNIMRGVVAGIDRFLMKFVDAIIIADETRIAQIGDDINKNIVVIYNSPKKDILKEINYDKSQQTDEFILFFGGSLSKDRNIDVVIRIVKNMDDVRLVIAGFGARDCEEELKKMSEYIKNVELFLGKIPYTDIITKTMESNLLFALYDPSVPNNRYASPNKLFEAMMCGKPIVVSDGTSMADVVRKYNCGVVVDCRNVREIRKVIIELKNNPQLCKQLGENGRKAYEEEYNWAIMENKLLKIYKNLRRSLKVRKGGST